MAKAIEGCPTPLRAIGHRSIFKFWKKEVYINAGDMLLWLNRQACILEAKGGDSKYIARGMNYVYRHILLAKRASQ